MKKLAVLPLLLFAAVVSTPTPAHAVTCYWATMYASGWEGFDLYAGRACYDDTGMHEMVSFTPIVPIG